MRGGERGKQVLVILGLWCCGEEFGFSSGCSRKPLKSVMRDGWDLTFLKDLLDSM